MKNEKPNKKSKVAPKAQPTRALIIQQITLTDQQRTLMQATTPPEFIKERIARGGKQARYVEGGYVVARLNQIFGAINWDFDIVDKEITPSEVWVRGKLTIKDHKNGYTISKSQFGTHERHQGVPLGDTLKAAATDSMKKCASLFGVALDVYWQQLDQNNHTGDTKVRVEPQTPAEKKEQKKSVFQLSKDKIAQENDKQILMQWAQKIHESKQFTTDEKIELIKLISSKVKK